MVGSIAFNVNTLMSLPTMSTLGITSENVNGKALYDCVMWGAAVIGSL